MPKPTATTPRVASPDPRENQTVELTSRLRLISAVTDRLVQTLDFDDALQVLIEGATELLQVERASIMIVDKESQTLVMKVAKGIRPEVMEVTRIPIGEGISGTVADTGEPIVVQDVRRLSTWQSSKAPSRLEQYDDYSALSVPLSIHGQVHGVMNFNHKAAGTSFDESDLEFALVIANQAAVALYVAMLHRQFLVKQEIENELRIAQSIQERMQPRQSPELPGFRVAARARMCREVGGDYYDFVPIAPGRIGIAIGDVAGHGLGPALLVANARASLRSSLRRGDSIEETLEHLNRLLLGETANEHFMTLLLGILDYEEKIFVYASAGHQMPLLVHGDRCADVPLYGSNIPLGIQSDREFLCEEPLELHSDDLLFLFTDGIWEATDSDGERFGNAGIERVLLDHRKLEENRLLEEMLRAVARHRIAPRLEDDYTLLALRCL